MTALGALIKRRSWGTAAVFAVALALGVAGLLFARFLDGVQSRRADNHAALIRQCEVGINEERGNLRGLVAALTMIAPPPKDAAEARGRADSQAIITRFLGPIDCQIFVTTGRQVPATKGTP